MRVRWSEGARADLISIFRHAAADDPGAARRLVARMRREVRRLGRYPRLGRVVPELDMPELREVIVPPYRILYVVEERVTVVTVHHGKRLLAPVDQE